MSQPISVQETEFIKTEKVTRQYTYDELLDLFGDDDGSVVVALVLRCQKFEAEVERLQTEIRALRKVMLDAVTRTEACGHCTDCTCCWCDMRRLFIKAAGGD